jgi:TctA family transporter
VFITELYLVDLPLQYLLNAPGVPGTVATSFDGYPMAQQGKAGKALAIAAWSSFAGGTLICNLFIVFGTEFIKSQFII